MRQNELGTTYIGKDWKKYCKVNETKTPAWLTIALYESGRHFNIKFSDLAFFSSVNPKDGKNNEFLAYKQNEWLIPPQLIPVNFWSKKNIDNIILPQRIIRMALIEKIIMPNINPFELYIKTDDKMSLVWVPTKTNVEESNLYNSLFFQKLIKSVPMEIITEEIELFFTLLDNKLMDLLVFTLASVYPLWKDRVEEKEKFIKLIFDPKHQDEVKREFLTHIYLYKMR